MLSVESFLLHPTCCFCLHSAWKLENVILGHVIIINGPDQCITLSFWRNVVLFPLILAQDGRFVFSAVPCIKARVPRGKHSWTSGIFFSLCGKTFYFEWTPKVLQLLNFYFILFSLRNMTELCVSKEQSFSWDCQHALLKVYGFPTVFFTVCLATLLLVPAGSRNCQRFMKMKNGEWNIL